MAVIHISEVDAARDFSGLLTRARAGDEIVIEKDDSSPVVLRVSDAPLRLLSESLRLAREHGSTATLDGGLEADLEVVVKSRPEPLQNPWG
jgi:antitoxin (DNA-binding transcriptional repressor) of toxin-antitoxin stability system